MDRRTFVKQTGAGAAAATLPFLFSRCNGSGDRPNIIYIMSDDHAFQAISAYGSGLNVTPNIDRLAKEGVRFTSSFCTNSICAPSRAVLLTGKYSHKNGVIDNREVFDGSQQTFPKLLRRAGYATAMIGKWHLKSDPTGFDYWNILPGQGHYYNPDFIEMGERKRVEGYVTDLITDFGLNWLKTRPAEQPFCLLLHHKAPHRSWMPAPDKLQLYQNRRFPLPETFYDDYRTRSAAASDQEMRVADHLHLVADLKLKPPDDADERAKQQWETLVSRMNPEERRLFEEAYEKENRAFHRRKPAGKALAEWKYQRYIKDYLRCISSVDDSIGRVLDYLDASGLADNTIVVYTADQGFYLGEHGWFDKRFMYEESLRMPLIIRYPGEAAPAVNENDMVLNLDFAPTFLDYAGVRIPGDMQGRSMRRVLQGNTPRDWRRSHYYHYLEYPAVHMVKRHYGVRTHRYTLIHFYYDIDAWELYDLEKDPRQLHNIYDTASPELVQSLKAELETLRKRYGDTDEFRFLPQDPVAVDHLANGSAVTLKYPPAARYSGGGPGALTDGLKAPDTLRQPADYALFQGFESSDLDAVIDLGGEKRVTRVAAGFIQNYQDWIFLPLSVRLSVSRDGRTWERAGEAGNPVSADKRELLKRQFRFGRIDRDVRYLRIEAVNRGVCPVNHPGEGQKAWLFADEIEVR
ncbi:sulfatase-like hydrolase/transferase [bacterium]|nr:sulfatase-like hydrolase/transferase [bacterium]